MILKVDEKQGFKTSDKRIRIYDQEGNLFYFRDHDRSFCVFNLPKGVYKTTNDLHRVPCRKYKLPQLPKRERNGKIPKRKDLSIIYTSNPHKASIYREKKLIIFDNEFKRLSIPQRIHAFFHELGHYYYSTEAYCDLFATREMLKIGFNPSQVYWSINGTLSDASSYRKEYILKHCEKA